MAEQVSFPEPERGRHWTGGAALIVGAMTGLIWLYITYELVRRII